MTPGRAAEEKEFLAIGHRVVGLANELAEKGMAFKLSLAYGAFIFNMDTSAARCLRIGEHKDNFVFDHILHFSEYTRVQLG